MPNVNSLENLRSLIGKVLIRTNEEIGYDEARKCIDDAWREIINMNEWSWARNTDLTITTYAPATNGLVRRIQQNVPSPGQSTITGNDDTSFLTAVDATGNVLEAADFLASLRFRVGNQGQPYKILSVANDHSLVIDGRPEELADQSNEDDQLGYSIFRYDYPLSPSVYQVLSMVAPDWPIYEVIQQDIHRTDPSLRVTGEPIYYYYTSLGLNENGYQKIAFWPTPDREYQLDYSALLRSAQITASQLIADISPLVLHKASALGWMVIAAKAFSNDRLDKNRAAMGLADTWQAQYSTIFAEFVQTDYHRGAQRDADAVDLIHPWYRGRTDIDVDFTGF